ncbi:thiamine pyrophosphate-dependent dehydrogenase E1 component subunit alpha [uncultured Enterovirga sp.]|uniref:thiamine pyrophosphate-dependent dehydrogenase E1 component subunit alpha n=1 Tax=uncultured Enterovirga sp. TaxID=2026352 RepID=UPI0035CC283B
MSDARARDRTIPNLDEDRLLAHLAQMWRIRAFEEQAILGLDDKIVLGAIHPSIGQEAIAVGICAHLRRDDVLLSTHRGHGHTLAKGAEPLPMMRELFGREGGNCGGKGGSMHIADFSVGMLGANGVVAANIVIAAGAAHAIKLKGGDQVVCCLFGDGAINRGPFLEGLNWAKVFNLPVLFVCEDNGFAATTRTKSMTGGAGPSARARAIGLAAEEIDGNDILAVDAAAREIVAAIRAGGGPRFLHAHTYRLTGHTGSDPALYRPEEEVEERRRDEPIARAAGLLGAGRASDVGRLREAAIAEMKEAYDTANATPFPPVAHAFHDVQDVGDPRQEAF